jgi:hypothetical protein
MDRARTAWKSAKLSAIATIVGMPIDLMAGRGANDVYVPWWPNVAAMAVAFVFLVFLWARRRRPSAAIAQALFLANAGVIIAALWMTNAAYATSAKPWVPFEANKLGMVIVAMLATEVWVGIVGILAYAAAPFVQMTTLDERAWSTFALAEPWATVAFGVFSGLLLAHQLRRIALEREIARARAEVAATQHAARIVLAVRDLSNTPLQTIALSTALARAKHPDLEPILRPVDRSLERLKELDETFRKHEAAMDWSSGGGSFDAPEWLRSGS